MAFNLKHLLEILDDERVLALAARVAEKLTITTHPNPNHAALPVNPSVVFIAAILTRASTNPTPLLHVTKTPIAFLTTLQAERVTRDPSPAALFAHTKHGQLAIVRKVSAFSDKPYCTYLSLESYLNRIERPRFNLNPDEPIAFFNLHHH